MSLNVAELTSSHIRWALYTALPSTLFCSNLLPSGLSTLFNGSDPSPLDHKKTDAEPEGEFLWHGIYYYMGIKDSFPKQANFCVYIWEAVVCMIITSKRRSSLDIWLDTFNQGTDTMDMILIIWYKRVMK